MLVLRISIEAALSTHETFLDATQRGDPPKTSFIPSEAHLFLKSALILVRNGGVVRWTINPLLEGRD